MAKKRPPRWNSGKFLAICDRDERNYTQIAAHVCLTGTSNTDIEDMKRWIRGKTAPRFDTALALAFVLGVDVSEFTS